MLEFTTWMYSQLFPFGMTGTLGLAGFAITRGFKALVIKEEEEFNLYFDYGYLKKLFINFILPIFKFNYYRIRTNTLNRGVKELYQKVDLDIIEHSVQDKKPPIVMVDQTGYSPDDDYPDGLLHWVVVTGFDSETVMINDPDLDPIVVSQIEG